MLQRWWLKRRWGAGGVAEVVMRGGDGRGGVSGRQGCGGVQVAVGGEAGVGTHHPRLFPTTTTTPLGARREGGGWAGIRG